MSNDSAKLALTDSEWIRLIDGESEDTQLARCCANCSSLRDCFIKIARRGRHDDAPGWMIKDLKRCLKWVYDGHALSPLLVNVCEQLLFDPSKAEHEPGPGGD